MEKKSETIQIKLLKNKTYLPCLVKASLKQGLPASAEPVQALQPQLNTVIIRLRIPLTSSGSDALEALR